MLNNAMCMKHGRSRTNCTEQMHDSQPSGRLRLLDQSEVVQTVGCSCPDQPESGSFKKLGLLPSQRNSGFPTDADASRSSSHAQLRADNRMETRCIITAYTWNSYFLHGTKRRTPGVVRICVSRRNRIRIHADAVYLITDKALNQDPDADIWSRNRIIT